MESLDHRFEKLENSKRIGYLIGGFITRTLTIAEEEELDAWILADEKNMELFEEMTEPTKVDEFMEWLAARDTETKLLEMKQRLNIKKKRPSASWWYYAAAACLAGIIALSIFYSPSAKKDLANGGIKKRDDIQPGSSYAELRLPSGQIIRLNEHSDTALQGIKISGGIIAYEGNKLIDTQIHEIRIPRKGSYQLVLPDGTKVWLNAESSISYPANFITGKRRVSVSGETYFEVAKDPQHPFIANAGNISVEALGTAFNINEFERKVTLTHGSIKVANNEHVAILQPGQQIETGPWKISEADMNSIIAWTKNEFKFRNARIEEVMQPVIRWYDAKIIYKDSISFHFNGTINRNVPVSELLTLLEGTGRVHFSIEGNTITVEK